MKRFHVLYKISENDFYSTGRDFSGPDVESALKQWREFAPNTYFMAIYVKE